MVSKNDISVNSSSKKKRTFNQFDSDQFFYRLERRNFLPLAIMRPYLDGVKSSEDIRYQRLQITLSDCALTIGESKLEYIMANFYEGNENSNQDCRFELDHREVNRSYLLKLLR